MTKTEYREYLSSDHWKETRIAEIEAAEGKCERCSIPRWLCEIVFDQDLHVHHKTYVNLGSEECGDLEVLCRRCHEVESFGRSQLPLLKPQACALCKDKHWDKRSDFCHACQWLTEGPNFFHILGVKHPHMDKPMWQYFMPDIALYCFWKDGGEELIEFIRNFIFNTKASLAGEIPF